MRVSRLPCPRLSPKAQPACGSAPSRRRQPPAGRRSLRAPPASCARCCCAPRRCCAAGRAPPARWRRGAHAMAGDAAAAPLQPLPVVALTSPRRLPTKKGRGGACPGGLKAHAAPGTSWSPVWEAAISAGLHSGQASSSVEQAMELAAVCPEAGAPGCLQARP